MDITLVHIVIWITFQFIVQPFAESLLDVRVAHWGSSRAGGAFAVLGAGAGFGHGGAVHLLSLDDDSMVREHKDEREMAMRRIE